MEKLTEEKLAFMRLKYARRQDKLNRFYTKWIERFHRNKGRLLDIGCGDGYFVAYVDAFSWDAYGVEVDKNIVKSIPTPLRTKIITVNSDLTEAGFGENTFDVVTLWNTFEHIAGSEKLLATIKKILKVGGLLAIQVPNIESLESLIFKSHWMHLNYPRHVHHFSFHTLSSVLNKNNFSVIAVNHFSPLDKSYRGSIEYLLRDKIKKKIDPYFFNSLFYKFMSDMIFTPLTFIGSVLKKGTFLTVACINEK